MKDRGLNWHNDNITVCSVITKTIDSSNYRHVRDHRTDAGAMWQALWSAHQDFTAGGRMYWLRKLVLYQMTDDDVDTHLDAMTVIYEKLNFLVTPSNPLTADDIFATALLISVPATWLHAISHLLNSPRTTSSQIVSCLKAESKRCASSIDHLCHSISVSKATSSYERRRLENRADINHTPRTPYDPEAWCSFCKTNGNDLASCKTTARVLSDHKDSMMDDFKKLKSGKSQNKKPEKVSKTQTVSLGTFSDDEDDFDDGNSLALSNCVVCAKTAIVANASRVGHVDNWTLDSAYSKSMTPTTVNMTSLKNDFTTINLADNSTIKSSHRGHVPLPVKGEPIIDTLVLRSLHNPLLSVANVCDKDLSVVFDLNGCKIYPSSLVNSLTPILGEGY